MGDLAAGHVAALQKLLSAAGNFTVNLGTGQGYSVLEVLRAFEQANGQPVPCQLAPRYADALLANSLLNWRATRSLADMCADAWRWQSSNPDGYR